MKTFVDMVFPVKGKELAWDHSYSLFGSISRIQPLIHQEKNPVGVFPVNGLAQGNRTLKLTPKSSLRLRVPQKQIADFLCLMGSSLELDGRRIRLGNPRIEPIKATPRLFSPWVTLSECETIETFLTRVGEELERLQIEASYSPVAPLHQESKDQGKGSRQPNFIRRTRQVKGQNIVGFALLVESLTAEDSMKLACLGLGGRRHFGGGLFLPARNR